MKDNYEALCRSWQEKFRDLDQTRYRRLLPELTPQGEYLTLTHFGRLCGIHCQTGAVTALDGGRPLSHDEQLNIYTLLAYCREDAALMGRWVPFREVPGAGPFDPAFQKRILRVLADTFSGHAEALRRAGAALGGTPLRQADVGFQLSAFACIPMRVLFWDGDDEFPAQANILYDAGVTGFIHVESTVTLASVALLRLIESSGIAAKGNTFGV